jgi:phosphonate transport system ATP-binding protein
VLEVRNLRLIYPNGYEALKSISFTAESGEIIGIVGRSGAGKSTLLRCINGLERPTSGEVILDGEDLTRLSSRNLGAVRGRIGFIWQEYNLVERISAMNNVLTGRLAHSHGLGSLFFHFTRQDREIAVRSLEQVNMLDRARQRADRLSGGEKQRVAIARAIAQEPRLILADEPVASLDPELSEQVLDDLSRVARAESLTTLINIHAVDLAKQFCDRIIGIAQGVVAFDGTPEMLDEAAMHRIYRFDRPAPIPAPTFAASRPRELVGSGTR